MWVTGGKGKGGMAPPHMHALNKTINTWSPVTCMCWCMFVRNHEPTTCIVCMKYQANIHHMITHAGHSKYGSIVSPRMHVSNKNIHEHMQVTRGMGSMASAPVLGIGMGFKQSLGGGFLVSNVAPGVHFKACVCVCVCARARACVRMWVSNSTEAGFS
jgi:hypothetical protein